MLRSALPPFLLLIVFGLAGCGSESAPSVPPQVGSPEAAVPGVVVLPNQSGYSFTFNGTPLGSFVAPSIGAVTPQTSAVPVGDGWSRISLQWQLPAPVQQDEVRVDVDLSFAPNFFWMPHLAPIAGQVASQLAFRSPALIASSPQATLALVPDLNLVGSVPETPWFLDLDAPARRLSLGVSRQSRPVEVLWQKEPGMTIPGGMYEIAFFVRTYHGVSNPFGPVRQFLWDRYGGVAPASGATLDDYVDQTVTWAFDGWSDWVWQDFDLGGGVRGGAPQFIVDATLSPHNSGPRLRREEPSLWNQAWFSSLRVASGLYRTGVRTSDSSLVARAWETVELTLSAPQRNGLFPAVFLGEEDPVDNGTEATGFNVDWTEGRWTSSDRVPTELGITRDWYHFADMSWTALWLLRWHQELVPDPRLLQYVERYAAAAIAMQDANGFFPAWVDPEEFQPAAVLSQSVETAMTAWFLYELSAATNNASYRVAAERALLAVVDGPVKIGQWEDFETYWSNNDLGRTAVGVPIARNGMFKQNTLGMYWVAGACLAAVQARGDDRFLGPGQRVLDEMMMWQQCWQPPFMFVPTVGGFGVMNADAEWNDARQSMFADLMFEWWRLTGEEQLFDRARAALHASFAMMYTPLNPQAKAQWEARFPFFGPLDYGFMMENYAHYEEPGPNGEGMGDFSIWTWGGGASLETWERVRDRIGSVFVDWNGQPRALDAIGVQPRSGGGWDLVDLASRPRFIRIVHAGGRAETRFLSGRIPL